MLVTADILYKLHARDTMMNFNLFVRAWDGRNTALHLLPALGTFMLIFDDMSGSCFWPLRISNRNNRVAMERLFFNVCISKPAVSSSYSNYVG